MRNKDLLIKIVLTPVVLYGLEILIKRYTNLGGLEAFINCAKGMCLRLETRNDVKLKVLNEKMKERQWHTNYAGEGFNCMLPLKTSESIA